MNISCSNSCLNCLISDQNLKGYKRSITLPDPYGYTRYTKNPILIVLADQARNGNDFPGEMTDMDLYNGIIRSLEDDSLDWPTTILISKDDWIEKTKHNKVFYIDLSRNAEEFQAFDHLVIEICANYLKRPIKLIPFPEGKPRVFHPKARSNSTKCFHILSCNTVHRYSFVASIFKKKNPLCCFQKN